MDQQANEICLKWVEKLKSGEVDLISMIDGIVNEVTQVAYDKGKHEAEVILNEKMPCGHIRACWRDHCIVCIAVKEAYQRGQKGIKHYA